MRRLLFASLLFCAVSLTAVEVPRLTARVTDLADIIDPATESAISKQLEALERSDATQLAVLTIPTLEGDAIEDFSIKVASEWKLGQKGIDNGALLIIAHNDRKLRIEVGYGLEGKLTDALSSRIIRNEIVPLFKKGRYSEGVAAGVIAMSKAVRGEYKAKESVTSSKSAGFIVFLIFFILMAFLRGGSGYRRRYGGYHSHSSGFGGSSFGSGGGFSGGGGSFGGGGSSGSW